MTSVYLIIAEEELSRHDEIVQQYRNAGYAVYSGIISEEHYRSRFDGPMPDTLKVKVKLENLLSCDAVAMIGDRFPEDFARLEAEIAKLTGKRVISVKGFK